MWLDLLNVFEIHGKITYPEISQREIAKFESERDIKLPDSYKSFCNVFGPGSIVDPFDYLIAAPGPSESVYGELRSLNSQGLEVAREHSNSLSPQEWDLIDNHAFFFGIDGGNNMFFWDTSHPENVQSWEYPVYVRRRLSQIHLLCNSFFDFVNEICIKSGIPGEDFTVKRERLFTPIDVNVP